VDWAGEDYLPTWEPLSNLDGAMEEISVFEMRYGQDQPFKLKRVLVKGGQKGIFIRLEFSSKVVVRARET
jgi:hypothetical protein